MFWETEECLMSGIDGQGQRASRINEHLAARRLPKRNIAQRGDLLQSLSGMLQGDFSR